jgi:Sec-independent protein secretion pathway component TatC
MAANRFHRVFEGVHKKIFAPMEDPKMPLAAHLEELRIRLTRAVIVLGIVFAISFYFSEAIHLRQIQQSVFSRQHS